TDTTASAGAGDVHAHGSIAVSADDFSDISEIVGVLAAGEVGVGAAVGVNIFNPDTEAFIGEGAHVTADGGGTGLTVNTGGFSVGSDTLSSLDPSNPSGVGIETSSPSTLSQAKSGARSSLRAAGQVGTPSLSDMDLHNTGSGESVPSDSFSRSTAVAQQGNFHGLAVGATNRDQVRTFTLSLAAGVVGVAVSAGVDVVSATTQAYIGDDAVVNGDTSAADSRQSVLVAAGNDFYHLAIAGTLAGGAVGVAPAVGVNVVTNDTEAWIGSHATVNALNDITVAATGQENLVMVGFGIAAGVVGVGGAVDVLSISDTTHASIEDHATVYAGGDVFVTASDQTQVLELSGALAGGLVGVGGSVGVMLISKDTQATIGEFAHVDASGNGTGVTTALDGTIVSDSAHRTTAHGVVVQAESSEDVLHIVAAGAGGFVGVSGAVGVTLISSSTEADVGANAVINGLHQGSANGNQSVYIDATNSATVDTFVIGIAGGFVGVSGAVDVGTLNNNVTAKVEAGATVNAKNDIEVNAVGLKDLSGFDASGAGGFVGVGGAVSVWSVGTQIQKSTKDDQGEDTGNATDGNNKSADSNAGSQADSARSTVTGSSGGGLGNTASGSGNSNDAQHRLQGHVANAANRVDSSSPKASDISNMENASSTPAGTTAQMSGTAIAGDSIGVKANEQSSFSIIGGQVSGGLVG
ncbi:MAG TPA: hypothetical protein VFN80_03575, partial [Acidothermaceae bacterium]|nr:hypothetical protein [Acidothermaceae bacterium]